MHRMSVLLLLTFLFLSSSCNNKQQKNEESGTTEGMVQESPSKQIPFELAKNYFVLNNYKDSSIHQVTIRSKEDFDKIFGMATTMGKDGKPTTIDFSKSYVIGLIGNISNMESKLSIDSIVSKKDSILVHYSNIQGPQQSFSSRPCILAIIDAQNTGEVSIRSK